MTGGYYSNPRLAQSPDGLVWTGITGHPYLTSSSYLAYGDGKYLISDGSRTYFTTDFSAWESVTFPIYNTYISDVIYREGRGFLLSTSNGYYESSDGVTVDEYTSFTGPTE